MFCNKLSVEKDVFSPWYDAYYNYLNLFRYIICNYYLLFIIYKRNFKVYL